MTPPVELPAPSVRRELREQARLSKAQAARALGISTSTLTAWETGREPTGEPRTKYAYLLEGLAAKLTTAPTAPAAPSPPPPPHRPAHGRGHNAHRNRPRAPAASRHPGRGSRGRCRGVVGARGVRAVRRTGRAACSRLPPAPGRLGVRPPQHPPPHPHRPRCAPPDSYCSPPRPHPCLRACFRCGRSLQGTPFRAGP
ncbi:helix-turn-helix domain-containing protein [Streptomyces cavourensis]|uniref:helix-turn-helix domain-containing protein n=1 Tax=Streptomyces cavourensis TaxID=67258 RepID=UPI003975E4FC